MAVRFNHKTTLSIPPFHTSHMKSTTKWAWSKWIAQKHYTWIRSMLQCCGADTLKQTSADRSRLDQTTHRDKIEAAENQSHKDSTNRATAITTYTGFWFHSTGKITPELVFVPHIFTCNFLKINSQKRFYN